MDIWKQLLTSNDRNRLRWAVLRLSQNGACTDLFENLRVNSLKGDLLNAITFKPPLSSLVNNFKATQVIYNLWRVRKGQRFFGSGEVKTQNVLPKMKSLHVWVCMGMKRLKQQAVLKGLAVPVGHTSQPNSWRPPGIDHLGTEWGRAEEKASCK